MLGESITYPLHREGALRTVGIGGVLTLFGVLVVPSLFVLGYLVTVARSVATDEETPPGFTDWSRLFLVGLEALAIGLGYFLVPSVLVVLGAAAIWTTAGIPLDPAIARAVLLGLGVAGLLAILVFGYVAPAGFVSFARTGRVRDAFAVRDLWPVLSSPAYARAWLLALAIALVGHLSFFALGATLVGVLPGAIVFFYAAVVSVTLCARGYAARSLDRSAPPSTRSSNRMEDDEARGDR